LRLERSIVLADPRQQLFEAARRITVPRSGGDAEEHRAWVKFPRRREQSLEAR
jgi:hypothetical protein